MVRSILASVLLLTFVVAAVHSGPPAIRGGGNMAARPSFGGGSIGQRVGQGAATHSAQNVGQKLQQIQSIRNLQSSINNINQGSAPFRAKTTDKGMHGPSAFGR